MIQLTIYSANGDKQGRIHLDLSKSQTATKILEQIRDGVPGWSMKSLEALDSGRLAFSHAVKLWSQDQVRQAIEARLQEINKEDDELKELRALLHDDGWADANGGPSASKTREAGMAREWNTLVGARKSQASGDLRKSRRVSSAVDVLSGFGWETMWVRKGAALGPAVFTNYTLPGHTISLEPETQHWVLAKGNRELAKSKATPTQNAANLMAELTKLSEQG